MPTKPSDKDDLVLMARRFTWMTLALYAILSIGQWVAHVAFPEAMAGVSEYTVSVSIIGAVTFGGLYAAAMGLRPARPRESAPAGAR